jgi:AcrR family transcriptional regulator
VFERPGRCLEIVRATFQQVATCGFEGLRLRRIAADVGVDQSTLHHYFPTKQHIVAAVAEYAIGQFTSTPPADTLCGFLDHMRTIALTRPEVFLVTVELQLRARRDPEVRAVLDRHANAYRDWLRDLLGEAGTPGAVELVIAVVNGVQLHPNTATEAFGQLITLFDDQQNDQQMERTPPWGIDVSGSA